MNKYGNLTQPTEVDITPGDAPYPPDLRGNELGDEGCAALAQSLQVVNENLVSLDLGAALQLHLALTLGFND